MFLRLLRSSLGVALLLHGLACPRTTSPGVDGGVADASVPADAGGVAGFQALEAEYCAPIAAWECESAAACGCIHADGTSVDVEACTADRRARCVERLQPLAGPLDAGLAVVLTDNVRRCVERMRALTGPCELPPGDQLMAHCEITISTMVPLGSACDQPICAMGKGACINGTCTAIPDEGAACQGLCRPGLACVDGVCAVPVPDGAACSAATPCASPARCVGGTCRPPADTGAACSSDEECRAGLRCEAGTCSAPSSCTEPQQACANRARCAVPVQRACASRLGVDAACEHTGGCADGLFCEATSGRCALLPTDGEACAEGVACAAGLGCNLERRCAPLPTAGQPCADSSEGPVCAPGFGCLDGTCGSLPDEGETCALPDVCAAGLVCDFTSEGSICTMPRAEGGACLNEQVCGDGLFCDAAADACAPDRAVGAPCPVGNECGPERTCLPEGPGAAFCHEIPGEGGECLLDCAPGLYCRTMQLDGVCAPEICRAVTGG